MSVPLEPGREELIDLLNRCWMTHDGMWFYHCLQEFGIEKANRLNKAAIKSLAPLEIDRMRKALGIENKIENFQELREFFERAAPLFIPPFMNASMSFPGGNVMHWAFAPKSCFAYKGIKRMGAIERYECGVIFRLACWFDSLGVKYRLTPPIEKCLMLEGDTCSGNFEFIFS
jgi:hypothetical protein